MQPHSSPHGWLSATASATVSFTASLTLPSERASNASAPSVYRAVAVALGLGTPKRLSLVPLKRGVQGQDMDLAMGKWELVQHVMCSA